jgi:molybdopterin-guanine dinucleotide biosynthesis protein A
MLAGVVLAGGKSSRMGKDKSLFILPDSQHSLLDHCYKKLALVCDDNVFISGAQHVQGIVDIIPNCGPLSGIHAVITHINTYHTYISELLVVPVDMPDLGPEDFNLLLKMGRASHHLCIFEKHFLPLYIPISTHVTQYLETVLKQPSSNALIQDKQRQYSLKLMLNSLQCLQIQPLRNTHLDNINTPGQWQKHCSEIPIPRHRNDS